MSQPFDASMLHTLTDVTFTNVQCCCGVCDSGARY